jgi:phage-related protein
VSTNVDTAATNGGVLARARAVVTTVAHKVATIASSAATKAAAAAQWLLNAAMTANPIGLIIIAIIALVAIFVVLWQKCSWFRNFWIGLWEIIKSAAVAAWNWIKSAFTATVQFFGDAWAWIKDKFTQGVDRVKFVLALLRAVFLKVIAWVAEMRQGAIDKFNAMVTAVREIPGKITSALGNLKDMLVDSGKSMIEGLIRGIKDKAKAAVDAVKGVLGKVRDAFPFSPAKTGPFSGKGWVLYSGHSIGEAFGQGIEQRLNVARSAALELAAVTQAPLSGDGVALPTPSVTVRNYIGNEELSGYIDSRVDSRTDARNSTTTRKLRGR